MGDVAKRQNILVFLKGNSGEDDTHTWTHKNQTCIQKLSLVVVAYSGKGVCGASDEVSECGERSRDFGMLASF